MVVERQETGQSQMDETLVYMIFVSVRTNKRHHHRARDDLLSTLDGVQIPGGMGNTNRGYVEHEGENLQEN
jgi:hypothetical protein